jgi:hypothetical protein
MDEIVKQAMAKWPNVPHCYGWLALDARGGWRMRDEAAQRDGLPGDKLTNAALVGFINRNYQHDERGCWYFQNGPQRVYVSLEATPFIARTDPSAGFVLQTGAVLGTPDQVFVTEAGQLILQSGETIAQLDDRDLAPLLASLELDGATVNDDALIAWLAEGNSAMELAYRGWRLPVQRSPSAQLAAHFGFVQQPQQP